MRTEVVKEFDINSELKGVILLRKREEYYDKYFNLPYYPLLLICAKKEINPYFAKLADLIRKDYIKNIYPNSYYVKAINVFNDSCIIGEEETEKKTLSQFKIYIGVDSFGVFSNYSRLLNNDKDSHIADERNTIKRVEVEIQRMGKEFLELTKTYSSLKALNFIEQVKS